MTKTGKTADDSGNHQIPYAEENNSSLIHKFNWLIGWLVYGV